jgi:transposase-like protein
MGSRRKLNVTLTGRETEDEIVEKVFQKNDWIRNTCTMEEFKGAFKFLARKRCQKSPKENLTFAVESRLHKALIERQKIGVGLTMVFVEEMVQVTRCYNCNGLGHISKSSQQKPKCHKCGKEGHKIKECRAEKSECGNWKQTGHRAYDRKCPTMKRALEWKIARPRGAKHTGAAG